MTMIIVPMATASAPPAKTVVSQRGGPAAVGRRGFVA
jgi:hypothetical protein